MEKSCKIYILFKDNAPKFKACQVSHLGLGRLLLEEFMQTKDPKLSLRSLIISHKLMSDVTFRT
jgi:hypothetical protein